MPVERGVATLEPGAAQPSPLRVAGARRGGIRHCGWPGRDPRGRRAARGHGFRRAGDGITHPIGHGCATRPSQVAHRRDCSALT